MEHQPVVTVKLASEMTGLTIKSIRYYEEMGLIRRPERSSGGYRTYAPDDIFRLQQICFYRKQRFSLEEIKAILSATDDDLRIILKQQIHKIERQINDLQNVKSMLGNALSSTDTEKVLILESEHLQEQLKNQYRHVGIVGIDLQNDFLEGGALPCRRIYNIIPPLQRLFREARKLHVPIIYVCDAHFEGDPELLIWKEHAIEGTWGAQIMDALKPGEQDIVLKKSYFNAFLKTSLQETLEKLDVQMIMLAGWRTHVCISQTAVEAFHRNYQVLLVEDGIDSTTAEEHQFGLNFLRVNYGIPSAPIDFILDGLRSGAIP